MYSLYNSDITITQKYNISCCVVIFPPLLCRALHNSLPWPTWPVALAPDYSLFLPLTHRAMDIYGSPSGVPLAAEPQDAAAGEGGEGGGVQTNSNNRNAAATPGAAVSNPLHRSADAGGGDIEMGQGQGQGRAAAAAPPLNRDLSPIAIGSSLAPAPRRAPPSYSMLAEDDNEEESQT
jgi:hypothetical protein